MRTITIEKVLYNYSELSESAKEVAREKFNQFAWDDGSAEESMQMIADFILEEVGLSPAKNLTYSLYSQGGFPTFETEGKWSYEGVEYDLFVGKIHTGGGNYYMSIALDEEQEGIYAAAYLKAKEFVYNLSTKMFYAFREEDENISSEENVSAAAEANGWEFDEFGNFA